MVADFRTRTTLEKNWQTVPLEFTMKGSVVRLAIQLFFIICTSITNFKAISTTSTQQLFPSPKATIQNTCPSSA